jgi:putative cell wall binding repeat protein/WD40 repeat protein
VPNSAAATVAALLLGDGAAGATIRTGDIHFSSTATDASWSADGSRIAFVDSSGNIATARPDGSDVQVLTTTNTAVKRADPAWTDGGEVIAFAERGKDGVWRLESIAARADGIGAPARMENPYLDGSTTHNHSPSSAYIPPAGPSRGVDLVAYEHDAASGPQVWIVDNNQRDPGSVKLLDGAQPALSPNGASLAYVGKNGQLYVTSVAKPKTSTATQVTFGLTGVTHPIWSPDGSRIAFGTATNVESVSAQVAAGTKANPVTVASTKAGVPTYVPTMTDSIDRFTGTDPIADSIAVSQQIWNLTNLKINIPSQSYFSPPTVVTLISTADPSALASVGRFASTGPVLFTDGKTLDPRTATEIKRALGKPNDPGETLTVQLFGGTDVISNAVEQAAGALGYHVSRMPAAKPSMSGAEVLVASDTDVAVTGNLAQLSTNFNVILLHGSALSAAQRTILSAEQALWRGQKMPVYELGTDAATAVQSWSSGKPALKVIKLATDPIDEALALAPSYDSRISIVATGDWKSILLANVTGSVVLVLPTGTSLPASATTWLHRNSPSISSVYAFGSTSAVPDATLTTIAAAISGPAGYTKVAS